MKEIADLKSEVAKLTNSLQHSVMAFTDRDEKSSN